MIDIVIPLRNDSTWNNNEIRYCLRSVEMYLKDIRNVYIVGYKPKFIHNVIHIPTNDPHPWVTFNIREKLLLACSLTELSDNFLFMNDDHYIMPGFDQNTYYHMGILADTFALTKNSIYRRIIHNTFSKVGALYNNWDVHTPIIMNKEIVPKALTQWEWPNNENEWGGFLIKTMYCSYFFQNYINRMGVDIKKVEDGKIREANWTNQKLMTFMVDKPVISSGDKVGRVLAAKLHAMFPNKSKYEL